LYSACLPISYLENSSCSVNCYTVIALSVGSTSLVWLFFALLSGIDYYGFSQMAFPST